MALRAIPNLWVVRPGDANETVAAWRVALEREGGPVAFALSRQKLPVLGGDGVADAPRARCAAGTSSGSATPARSRTLIVIATGSELSIALEAARARRTRNARVVSLPCWELFDAQPQEYRDEVLPPSVKARVSIEAGVTFGWERWVGPRGASVGVDRFGASAPVRADLRGARPHPAGRRRRRRARRLMRVAAAFDHRGVQLRDAVFGGIAAAGTSRSTSASTPTRCASTTRNRAGRRRRRSARHAERGVLVCGSGVGASVAACKITGIRAAICHDAYSAHQGVEHDDMNVLCLGSEIVGPSLARELVAAFLARDVHRRAGRYLARLEKVEELERLRDG